MAKKALPGRFTPNCNERTISAGTSPRFGSSFRGFGRSVSIRGKPVAIADLIRGGSAVAHQLFGIQTEFAGYAGHAGGVCWGGCASMPGMPDMPCRRCVLGRLCFDARHAGYAGHAGVCAGEVVLRCQA